MFKLDDNFLQSIGLGPLPVEEKNKMLAHIYERLEMNVGMRLAEQMTDAQLDEFEGFIDTNNESGALAWLEHNFPDYKQVVAEELEKLKMEITQLAPQILAASHQDQPQQLAPQQPQPYQQPQYAPPVQAAPPQFQQPPAYEPMPPQYPEPSQNFGSPDAPYQQDDATPPPYQQPPMAA